MKHHCVPQSAVGPTLLPSPIATLMSDNPPELEPPASGSAGSCDFLLRQAGKGPEVKAESVGFLLSMAVTRY